MKNFIKKTGIITFATTTAFIAWFGIQLTYGWTGPTQNPLNGNIPELINQTSDNQLKTGSLIITGFFESLSRAIFNSNVGIGVSSAPAAKLHLEGGNFLQTAENQKHIGSIDRSDCRLTYGCNLAAPYFIYVSGKYAYVASYGDNGVEILDISNPANPTHVGKIDDSDPTCASGCELNGATSIYVSGKYAYVAAQNDDGVEILDISNPTNPTHVGKIDDSDPTCASGCELNGARNIYVSGKYAYVVGYDDAGVEILDISNPSAPTHTGSIKSNDCIANGCKLNRVTSLYVSGKYAYVTSDNDKAVNVLNISNPASPGYVISIDDNDSSCGGKCELDYPISVFVSGKYAYVAGYQDNGIEILDISGIDAPAASIGNISASNINIINDAAAGNNLYVGNGLNSGANGIDSSGPISANTTSYLGGSVGIGTTNPGSNKLKIEGGIMRAYDGLILEQTNVTPPETGRLWIIP